MQIIKYEQVQEKIIDIRNQKVIIDSDVADLYQVETKRINEAVSRNPDKFPIGYLIELTKEEWEPLKSQFATSTKGGKVKLPIAFTERGLYMLATILKSPKATETTLAIIDTFAKVKELSHVIKQVQSLPENSPKQKTLMESTGDLIADLIVPDDEMEITGTETTFEINLALFKIKKLLRKIKQKISNNEFCKAAISAAAPRPHLPFQYAQHPKALLRKFRQWFEIFPRHPSLNRWFLFWEARYWQLEL